MGTVQMIVASVVMGIVGACSDGTARPMVIAFALCSIAAFVITQMTLGKGDGSRMIEVPAE
jgi:DHA1 family bicyclomycin/chloramphenicol resistance-like MFS transporter